MKMSMLFLKVGIQKIYTPLVCLSIHLPIFPLLRVSIYQFSDINSREIHTKLLEKTGNTKFFS